ncbi:lipopolysaccharide biosynthesis protein [Morganella morganii]|uniref:lipopolysaccharide biosynthesis protein n=1 Tax=Morganella morganii TaxID=582 RepID=UPI002024CD28|nr:lipopolysaccharide biosynthesis protein [Morganella morganii]
MILNLPNSLQRFIKQIITFILITGVSRLLPFLLTPIFTNYISPSSMGVLEIILAIYSLTIVLGIFQIDTAFQRYFFEEKNIISNSLLIITVTSIAISFTTFLLSNKISIYISGTKQYSHEIITMAATITVANIYSLLVLALRFSEKNKEMIAVILLQSFSFSLLSYILIIVNNNGIIGYLNATLYSYIISSIVTIFYFRKRLLSDINLATIKRLVNFSYPQTPARIASVFMQNGNRFIILLLLGGASVGVFSISNKMAILMGIVLSAFCMVWYPILYKDTKNINYKELNNIFKLTLLTLPVITILLGFISYILFKYVVNTEYQYGFSTSLILILSASILIIKEMADIGIKIKEKTYLISVIYLLCLTLSYLLMFFIAPKLHLEGIALSILISNISMLLLTLFTSNKILKRKPFNITPIYSYIIFCIIYVILAMNYNHAL